MFGIRMLLLSPRGLTTKHGQWTHGDVRVRPTQPPVGRAGVESGRTNDPNETNWNRESGRLVHVKELFVQTERAITIHHLQRKGKQSRSRRKSLFFFTICRDSKRMISALKCALMCAVCAVHRAHTGELCKISWSQCPFYILGRCLGTSVVN